MTIQFAQYNKAALFAEATQLTDALPVQQIAGVHFAPSLGPS